MCLKMQKYAKINMFWQSIQLCGTQCIFPSISIVKLLICWPRVARICGILLSAHNRKALRTPRYPPSDFSFKKILIFQTFCSEKVACHGQFSSTFVRFVANFPCAICGQHLKDLWSEESERGRQLLFVFVTGKLAQTNGKLAQTNVWVSYLWPEKLHKLHKYLWPENRINYYKYCAGKVT